MKNDPQMSDQAKIFYLVVSKAGTRAMLRAKADGQWTHRAPIGFLNARHDQGPVLIEDPKTLHFLVMARELRSKG